MAHNSPQLTFDEQLDQFNCTGAWSVMDVGNVVKNFTATMLPKAQKVRINGKEISHFDSAGALTLIQCIDELKRRDNQVELLDFSERQHQLLNLITDKHDVISYKIPAPKKENIFYQLGKTAEKNYVRLMD